MSQQEINRALSYVLATSRLSPSKSPSACMDCLLSLAPIERDSEDYKAVYYEFLRWYLTRRLIGITDVATRSKTVIGLWTRLSRISQDDKDLTGDITIDGITYNLPILREVVYDILFDGLIKTLDR